jgi:3-oxoadipate CoA-transferase, beta subunit
MTAPLTRKQIAWRAAQDIPDGSYVNLGVGLPTLVSDYVPTGRDVIYQSENGILGMGPAPKPENADPDLINATKQPVTLVPGASIFHTGDAFAMIRGGHIDYALLGAFQVAPNGDLANWTVGGPGKPPSVGGAMDLAAGAANVWVLMEHTTRDGGPRLLERCTYPLTAPGVVKRVYTSLAVIGVETEGLVVHEILEGLDLADLRAQSGAELHPAADCSTLRCPPL